MKVVSLMTVGSYVTINLLLILNSCQPNVREYQPIV